MSSSSQDGNGEGEIVRYPTVGPGAAPYEGYESREDGSHVRIYESDREDSGAWLASTVALSRTSIR